MATAAASSRSVLIAGATGLVGRELLSLLLASPQVEAVHVLLRRAAALPADPRIHPHEVNFDALPALPPVDDVLIALGTTIKAAGSQAAFRRVDFDAVVNTARAGRAAGASRLAVISALGADAGSRVFYNRVKGEMQDAVARLGYRSVLIAQPSLLVGDRGALGQPHRPGEAWAMRLLEPVLRVVPRRIRPVEASAVARAVLATLGEDIEGLRVLSSAQMQRYAA
ncbi:MAG TPA: NAD(P)H-binding protein [Albitalea sp.]